MIDSKGEITFKVAAVQFEPELGIVKENRRRIVELAIKAASQGAKLIVFPEMATSGYVWENRQEIARFVETIPGETTAILSEVTQQYDCYIVIGMPEKDQEKGTYYNSAVLLGPTGVVGSYRKTHLFSADPRWACEGKEEIPVFETSLGKIAMLICMDAMYFEPARIAAIKGAEIIAFPTNWVGASGNKPPSNTWRLRAKENGLFWIASNRFGSERGAHFTGGSAIIDPSGEVQASLVTGEDIVFGEIHRNFLHTNKVMTARKPHAYQEILLNSYLWSEGETRHSLQSAPFEVRSFSLGTFSSLSALKEYLRSLFAESVFSSNYSLIVLSEIFFSDERPITLEDCQNFLTDLATEYSIYIISSYTDKNISNDPISFMVSAQGCLGEYVQVHAGDNKTGENACFKVIELPFLRVGLLSGFDAQFSESFRVLSKLGADFIAVTANNTAQCELWEQKIRAYENDVILSIATPISQGRNLIFLHSKVSLESSGETRSLYQYFSPDMMEKVKERPFLRRLNHHLYDKLIEEING